MYINSNRTFIGVNAPAGHLSDLNARAFGEGAGDLFLFLASFAGFFLFSFFLLAPLGRNRKSQNFSALATIKQGAIKPETHPQVVAWSQDRENKCSRKYTQALYNTMFDCRRSRGGK